MKRARTNLPAIRKKWIDSLNKAQSHHHDDSSSPPDVPNRPSDLECRVGFLQILFLAERGGTLSDVSVAWGKNMLQSTKQKIVWGESMRISQNLIKAHQQPHGLAGLSGGFSSQPGIFTSAPTLACNEIFAQTQVCFASSSFFRCKFETKKSDKKQLKH